MSDAIRLHGTTIASAALRHEVPLAIGDPFAFLEIDGRPAILTNTLEHARVFQARPGAQLTLLDELGYHDLVRQGVRRSQAQLEAVSRWVARHGLRDTVVPPDCPSRCPTGCAPTASCCTSTRTPSTPAAA